MLFALESSDLRRLLVGDAAVDVHHDGESAVEQVLAFIVDILLTAFLTY